MKFSFSPFGVKVVQRYLDIDFSIVIESTTWPIDSCRTVLNIKRLAAALNID